MICAISDCSSKAIARRLCRKHYMRAVRGGTLESFAGAKPPTLEERLRSKIQVDASGCWLWTGQRRHDGYGMIWKDGRACRAHVVVYELLKGRVRRNYCVCHTCDVRNCVNPEHLFLGTRAVNNHDMKAKNRCEHSERHHASKLTAIDVLAIRAAEESHHALGKRYGVGPSVISRIRNRKAWRRV
jgi:hypothetical protein